MANTLTFANLTLTDAEIYGGISFLADLNAGDEFTVGNTASASVSFETETQLPLYSKDATNGTFTWTQDSTNRGRYYITEVTKSGGKYTVTAYDGMILLETGISALGAVTYPVTVSDLADAIETYSGYTITGTLNNGSLTCEGLDDTLTVRQLLGYIAAISGASVKLNASGELCLMYYTDSGITLTASDYKEIETADYVCSAIDCVKLVGSDGIVTATAGTGSNTLYVSGNPFTDSATDTNAQAILSVVGGITYKPLTCSLFSEEGLEVGTGATFGTDYTLIMSIEASTENGATVSSVGSDSRSEYNSDLDPKIYEAVSVAKAVIKGQYEQAIEEATELIRGGMGGYVVAVVNGEGQPIELLITDNLNLRQAVNVWRWNQNGLAHSSNGYNGPFTDVAITADGKINASVITAGTITDVDGDNYWNLDTGEFVTEKGKIASFDISGSRIQYKNNYRETGLNSTGFWQIDKGSSSLTNPPTYYYRGTKLASGQLRFMYGTGATAEEAEANAEALWAFGVPIAGGSGGLSHWLELNSNQSYPYNNYMILQPPTNEWPIQFGLPVRTGDLQIGGFLRGDVAIADGRYCIYNGSTFNPLIKSGTASFSSVASGTYSDVTITHGIGVKPNVVVSLQSAGTTANMGNVSVSVAHITTTQATIRLFNNRPSSAGAISPNVTWIATIA